MLIEIKRKIINHHKSIENGNITLSLSWIN